MKILLTESQLQDAVKRMAGEVRQQYGDAPLTVIAVLTGSLVLMADLMRQLTMPLRIGVVQASSYRTGTTREQLLINAEWTPDIADRDVLLVDDIYDTGHTLVEVMRGMQRLQPRSLRSAVLLRKQGRQEVEQEPDFVGFEIPDAFVVGYGLDYRDAYRNLPHVAVLEPGDISDAAS